MFCHNLNKTNDYGGYREKQFLKNFSMIKLKYTQYVMISHKRIAKIN